MSHSPDLWNLKRMEMVERMKEKEIDYKEKYEQALERAKIKRDEYMRLDGPESYVPQDIEYIFPEIAESENEKIRSEIIHFIKRIVISNVTEEQRRMWIAWLEKQGEKKSTWSEEDEEMLQKALSTIRYALSIPIDKEDEPCFVGSSTISWLKSLKERLQPKQELSENAIVKDYIRDDKLWEKN